MASKKIYDILPPKDTGKERAAVPYTAEPPEEEAASNFPRSGSKIKKTATIIGAVFLFLVVILGFLQARLLEARVAIWPAQEQEEFRKEIRIDAGAGIIDLDAAIIPGRIIKSEEEIVRQFSASEETTKESKARGTMRVYNNYHLLQVLVATTRFLSADGELFRSTQRVTIPPGGEQDVEVEAAEPGEDYNIGPSTFSIPGLAGTARYTQVYGKSLSKMDGGGQTLVSQVTAEDISRAADELRRDLTKKGREKILAEIEEDENLVFFEEAVLEDVGEPEILVDEGAEVDSFQAEGRVTTTAFVFSAEDFEEFVSRFILKEAGPGKAINEQSLNAQAGFVNIDWEKQELIASISGSVNLYPEFSIEELKGGIAGQTIAKARALLEEDTRFARSQIKLWPLPWRSVPKDFSRIKIAIRLTED